IENAQHAPSDEIAPRECGWKHGDSGYSAGQELCRKEPRTHYEPRIPLTPTGLLMEAHYTTNPPSAIQVAANRTGSPACCSQFSLGVRSKLPCLFKSILVTRRDEASRSPYPTTDCKSECRAAMSSSGPRWLTT